MTQTRYVENVSPGGWLNVRLTASNRVVPLPYMLKVAFEKRTGGRDYFKILEGLHINQRSKRFTKKCQLFILSYKWNWS
jgi:hypothetical protein